MPPDGVVGVDAPASGIDCELRGTSSMSSSTTALGSSCSGAWPPFSRIDADLKEFLALDRDDFRERGRDGIIVDAGVGEKAIRNNGGEGKRLV